MKRYMRVHLGTDLNIKEENDRIDVTLENEEETITYRAKKILKDETTNRYELEIIDNDKIAFDHALVILTGYDRLKNKIEYTDIVFNMMPKYFTLGELQQVYGSNSRKRITRSSVQANDQRQS